jgi:hypothetical protein
MRADRRWHTRKEKKEWARRLQSNDPGLDVIHPQAAGIDVGNASHYVAVRPDRDLQPVRQFKCFTADLHRLADWLKGCGVRTPSRCSRPGSTGFPCTTFWKSAVLRCTWSTRATPRICRGAREGTSGRTSCLL